MHATHTKNLKICTSCTQTHEIRASEHEARLTLGFQRDAPTSSRLAALSSSALSIHIINNFTEEERGTTVTSPDLWHGLGI